MNQTNLPMGCNDEKIQQVLAHYEGQTDEEALAEDEAELKSPNTRECPMISF